MMGRQRQQMKFTDIKVLQSWEQRPLVPQDSFYYTLSQADDIFRDELFADCYSSCGRPSIPPSRLIKVLLLQFYEGVSDREAEQRAFYDLRWKVAPGLSLGEAGFDHTDLTRFRARLLLHKKERAAFEEIINAAQAKGLLPQRLAKQVIDSTHVLGQGQSRIPLAYPAGRKKTFERSQKPPSRTKAKLGLSEQRQTKDQRPARRCCSRATRKIPALPSRR